jgi:hypothetical protein
MSFTMADLLAAMRSANPDVSEADVALAYVRIDQPGMQEEQRSRITWKRWEGESIGGARPIDIRSRNDYQGGEIYLIYIDGELVYLQPHDPESFEPIREDELEDVVERHIGTIVDDLVFRAVVAQVVASPSPSPVRPEPMLPRSPVAFLPGRGAH